MQEKARGRSQVRAKLPTRAERKERVTRVGHQVTILCHGGSKDDRDLCGIHRHG
jgi:hypothetical protein